MTINYKKQSQFELFPGGSSKPSGLGQPRLLFKDLTLSLENIIVLCIVLIMVLVFFFSMGVEKGRRIAGILETQDSAALEGQTDEAIGFLGISEESMDRQSAASDQIDQKSITEENIEILEIPEIEENIIENNYTIQVASFKLEKNARREAEMLKGIGYDIFVMSKGNYSIVCVGKFAQRQEAKRFAGKLKSKYKDCLVRRL